MTAVPVVVHGHFYQPPRDDPWSQRVPAEPSAAPFHDWNERILSECYRPLTRVPLFDAEERVRAHVNVLEWINWDAGATLLEWLAREDPTTYAAFLEADRRSRIRLGFGNALAAPYHHVILPLASPRDRVTEVRWGIRDFQRRFGRDPEGMWLPETAVDLETLDVLAAEGIAFTVLAPHQFASLPTGGRPGRVQLSGGRTIAVFPYAGALSHGVAFGEVLRDAWLFVDAIARMAREPGQRLVALATDGETFGHHFAWGDLALGAALARIDAHRELRLANFTACLHHEPPDHDVTIIENTSWSCSHGIERWRSDCGCRAHPERPGQQRWRSPLRLALDELAAALDDRFEHELGPLFADPWATRNAWIATFERPPDERLAWIHAHARRPLAPGEAERALTLFEVEFDALRMFTSCGWFFDELSGIESLQVLRYAAHALDLLGPDGAPLEARLVARLSEAPADGAGDGATIWRERVRAPHASPEKGGHVAPHAREAAPLVAAVRTFTRIPTPDGARPVLDLVPRPRQTPDELADARARFGRAVVDGTLTPSCPIVREVGTALGLSAEYFGGRTFGGAGPVGFVFGLHLHQPFGNFDHVIEEHCDRVYLPLLKRLADRGTLPLTLHVSGPLLTWLEARAHPLIDLMGALAARGSIELLASGVHEPVLPVLSRAERVGEIAAMRERLRARFGVSAPGLWLTERVWEPDLADDLAAAGIEWAFVDDRHLRVTGIPAHRLDRPYRTASGGRAVTLLPIDERLRYLVPFRPVAELERHLRTCHASDASLAVLADDAEKFGGWPGTWDWVWIQGWLDAFCNTVERLRTGGIVDLMAGSDAVATVTPAGPAWPPSASYREMEEWSLPPDAARLLDDATAVLDRDPAGREARVFLRGGHWRNFLARYPEAARMQAKADRLSALAVTRDAPAAVREAIGRARCNDAYWHGVFGGIHLRHLRGAIWAELAQAEEWLRRDEALDVEECEGPGGTGRELYVHSAHFAATIALDRGGALAELLSFDRRRNLADTLTRRREHYHRLRPAPPPAAAPSPTLHAGTPSIHEREADEGFDELPPFDIGDRLLTAERIVSAGLTHEAWMRGEFDPLHSWTALPAAHEVARDEGGLLVHLRFEGWGRLEKTLRFSAQGAVRLTLRWDPGAFPPDALFALELSLAHDIELSFDPSPLHVWRHDLCTVVRSESGIESTVQGESVTLLWPAPTGRSDVCLGADQRMKPRSEM